MGYDDYIDTLKSLLLKQLVSSTLSFLLTKFTFLAWGPLAPILKFFLEKLFQIAIEQTELAIYLLYTDFRISAQGRNFHKTLEENQKALKEGDKDAEERVKDSFRELVKYSSYEY